MDELLADLLAEYERNPSAPLARTIELIREEIELRQPVAIDLQDARWTRLGLVDLALES
jgi:hypothetical protein